MTGGVPGWGEVRAFSTVSATKGPPMRSMSQSSNTRLVVRRRCSPRLMATFTAVMLTPPSNVRRSDATGWGPVGATVTTASSEAPPLRRWTRADRLPKGSILSIEEVTNSDLGAAVANASGEDRFGNRSRISAVNRSVSSSDEMAPPRDRSASIHQASVRPTGLSRASIPDKSPPRASRVARTSAGASGSRNRWPDVPCRLGMRP